MFWKSLMLSVKSRTNAEGRLKKFFFLASPSHLSSASFSSICIYISVDRGSPIARHKYKSFAVYAWGSFLHDDLLLLYGFHIIRRVSLSAQVAPFLKGVPCKPLAG